MNDWWVYDKPNATNVPSRELLTTNDENRFLQQSYVFPLCLRLPQSYRMELYASCSVEKSMEIGVAGDWESGVGYWGMIHAGQAGKWQLNQAPWTTTHILSWCAWLSSQIVADHLSSWGTETSGWGTASVMELRGGPHIARLSLLGISDLPQR